MRVLLMSPWRLGERVSGDDILTQLFLDRPPMGVRYEHYAAGLEAGWLKRTHPFAAWFTSLAMHSRPPAGVGYQWPGLPPLSYRLLGKLLPDRPDLDVLWVGTTEVDRFDLVHAYMHPVQLTGTLRKLPLVLGNASGNTDLLRHYYGLTEADILPMVRRDRRLLQRFGIDHDLYQTSRARYITVPSQYAWRLHLEAGVPAQKLRLVRIGMEKPLLALRAPEGGECRFTLVGHGFWRKGGATLVAAFQRLKRECAGARLTIVSHLEPQDLGPGFDMSGIDIIPSLPRSEVLGRIYPQTDVYMLPSLAEGYGMSVVEAMGAGLPVIASAIAALPELVEDGITGLLVPPGDVEALFVAMRTLLQDPARREAMGQAGRAAFEQQHDVEVTNQALAAVYAEALA
jgi:glycosyltransferase involved in cell wall biosynthesis